MTKAKASDSATVTEADVTLEDPTVEHHLGNLQAEAKSTKKEQRKILASGKLDEGIGDRVLVVQPNGSYEVVFQAGK